MIRARPACGAGRPLCARAGRACDRDRSWRGGATPTAPARADTGRKAVL